MTSSQISDAISISTLFSDEAYSKGDLEYKKRELEFIAPQTATSTTSARFDMGGIVDRWTDFSKAFLYLPINVHMAADMVDVPDFPGLAFKTCALSAITRVACRTAGGTTIFDEQNVGVFSNALRLLMESDENWEKISGPELHYARDRPADGVFGMNTTATIASPSLAKYTGAPGTVVAGDAGNKASSSYNQGFSKRNEYFRSACVDVNGVPSAAVNDFKMNLRIPLSYLHDFFKQLKFPLLGVRLVFEFYLDNPTLIPITVGATVPGTALAGGNGVITIDTSGLGPRLYYESVFFKASQSAVASSRLVSGFSKLVKFKTHLLKQDAVNKAPGAPVSFTIDASAVQPKRVWVLTYPTGLVAGSTWPSVLITGPNGLTNVQLSVNNKTQYNNYLSTSAEQYAEFLSSARLGGSSVPEALISYEDFRLRSRLMCLDLSRLAGGQADPNAPVVLQIAGSTQSAAGVNTDTYYIIESEQQALFNFSTGGVSLMVGPGLDKSQ